MEKIISAVESINEKQDSISVSKNSKGFVWDIKIYFDQDKRKPEEVIKQIEDIHQKLEKMFPETKV